MSTTAPADLFPASAYDLPIPTLDGHKANKLVLAIGGTIELDRTNTEHLDLINDLELGRDISYHVTFTVTGKGYAYKATDDDETTSYQIKLRAHTIQ